MLFNSIAFLLFFPVVCAIYYCIPASWLRARNVWLLLASYYFYMSWEPVYALLLLTTTVVTYFAALGISRFQLQRARRGCLVAAIVLCLTVLMLFKYYGFLASNIEELLRGCGWTMTMPRMRWLLPVGISFYTFQAIGYTVDVFRRTTPAERDFPTYALFVAFFPQLVAGPIERSTHLLPQFHEQHRFDYDRALAGVCMMMWGYFLKLAMADSCGLFVDMVYNHLPRHTGGSYLVAVLLFPFQIYGDFAGYSLIAIGAARVMGFRLMENFRRPYFACSVGEFWHRWHISLSTWFKDYVYIPLGGNRVPRWRNYFNLLVTFVLSGMWHGANWTFLCWGALHGVLLCGEKALHIGRKTYSPMGRCLHWAVTFLLVSMAWILFRADSLGDAMTIFTGIFTHLAMPMPKYALFMQIAMAIGIVLAKEIGEERGLHARLSGKKLWLAQHIFLILGAAYLLLFGVLDGAQFIYFQF